MAFRRRSASILRLDLNHLATAVRGMQSGAIAAVLSTGQDYPISKQGAV